MNKRNLKYIGKQILLQTAYMLGLSLLMILWFWFVDGDESLATHMKQYPNSLMFMIVITLFAFGMNNFTILLQNLIAYGATRKNALFTILATEFSVMLIGYLVLLIVTKGSNALFYFSLTLLGFGVSLLLGLLVYLGGRKGYMVFVFLCAIIGGVTGALISSGNSSFTISDYKFILLPVALVIFVVSILATTLFTRRISVKM